MAPAEARSARPGGRPPRRSSSLFARTFVLLSGLLLACIAVWLQVFIVLEIEPRALGHAQQLASLVNLSRASLRASDAIGRVLLIKTLAEEEGLRISVRQASDHWVPRQGGLLQSRIDALLAQQIGASAVVAESVNGEKGLWIGFDIEDDAYWLRTDEARLGPSRPGTWALWLLTATALSLLGSAAITRVINQPLRALAQASTRLRQGQGHPRKLDEGARTSEIREVNVAFNRMSEQLQRLAQERQLLLAGISHDLRTPLARLQLEAQMSVPDPRARQHMSADIAQMDAIIEQFLAHPQSSHPQLQPLTLMPLVEQACFALAQDGQVHIRHAIDAQLQVLADPVELMRVLSNLLENARRYGRSADGISRIEVQASATAAWVLLQVIDHGPGVSPDQLHQLTRPYFRAGDQAHLPTGQGLGLAIVEGSMLRMGGGFSLSLNEAGGLCASLRLRRA